MCRSIPLLALVAGALTAPTASASGFFLFSPTAAKPGESVILRSGGTPRAFVNSSRLKPFQQALRIYLVRDAIADDVKSRSDQRLVSIGVFVPGKNGAGVLRFNVPKLSPGTYTTAFYRTGPCEQPGICGPRFFTRRVEGKPDILPQYARELVLRVRGSTSFP